MSDVDIFSATENIIEILSNMQDFLRRPVIKNKLERFYLENERLQKETIVIIISTLGTVTKDIDRLIYVWLDVLSELESPKINRIAHLYLEQFLKDTRLFDKINSETIINQYYKLEEGKRKKLKACFIETLFNVYDREIILKKVPKRFFQTD
ncbi:MAG: hypothetical protein DA328_01865 [Nitrososphaeraceae archaeon]|nr:hypothetical protein [Nitrososphaeraceae archaeon]